MEDKKQFDEDQPSKTSKVSIEYLSGTVDALKDRISVLDQREARLISSASTATTWLRVALGVWTVFLFGIVGINAVSAYKLDGVIQEAKNEVRAIAGSSRPETVEWGRVEPG